MVQGGGGSVLNLYRWGAGGGEWDWDPLLFKGENRKYSSVE